MSTIALDGGTLFARRYRIERCLATGGMGAVYSVEHLETGRRCALKVMLPHIVGSPDLRKRFRQEARVTAQIESDHIVDVWDAGIDEATGMPFLVMELLAGLDLGAQIEQHGALGTVEVVDYLRQVARALEKTHKRAIVHRDLKPENLFITQREDSTPHIKVLDFGIAKVLAEGGSAANATRSVGTPLYMAPEQFSVDTKIGPPADIYALGMLAYTMLVGTAYWEKEKHAAPNVFAFAALALKGPHDPATKRAAQRGVVLAPAFDAWFAKATAFLPERRFGSAMEAVNELARIPVLRKAKPSKSAARNTPAVPAVSEQSTHSSLAHTKSFSFRPPSRSVLVGIGCTVIVAAVLVLALIRHSAQRIARDEKATPESVASESPASQRSVSTRSVPDIPSASVHVEKPATQPRAPIAAERSVAPKPGRTAFTKPSAVRKPGTLLGRSSPDKALAPLPRPIAKPADTTPLEPSPYERLGEPNPYAPRGAAGAQEKKTPTPRLPK